MSTAQSCQQNRNNAKVENTQFGKVMVGDSNHQLEEAAKSRSQRIRNHISATLGMWSTVCLMPLANACFAGMAEMQ